MLDVDDCTVDVSLDNLVLLLKKEEVESEKDAASPGMWDRCRVGPDVIHTEVC